MMDFLEFVFELILELIQEYCFHLIRRYVKNPFLRGVLYVLTVLLVVAIAFGIVVGAILLVLQLLIGILDWIGSLFA